MSQSKLSRHKRVALCVLCLGSGVVGTLIGRTYAVALSTEPAWLGPAILVGSLALLLIGVLCAPAAIRAWRRKAA